MSNTWIDPVTSWIVRAVLTADLDRTEGNIAAIHSGGGKSTLSEISIVEGANHINISNVESKFKLTKGGVTGNCYINSIYSAGRLPGCTIYLLYDSAYAGALYLQHNATPVDSNYSKIMLPGGTGNELQQYSVVALMYDGTKWCPVIDVTA